MWRHGMVLLLAVAGMGNSVAGDDAAIDNPVASKPAATFSLHKLAEGLYATERKEPAGLMFDANNVFLIREHDVVVVDSNISPDSTREVLAALRQLTDKPVRYFINTH